ncbi:MAG: hypothetical protein H7X83_02880, partial [Verrucomicrobia bacterium]|nr:hypothetical protein [Deltaproteobacteria bacterium]
MPKWSFEELHEPVLRRIRAISPFSRRTKSLNPNSGKIIFVEKEKIMALMVRKKVGSQSSSFVESMNRISAMEAVADVSGVDDSIDFGFDGDGSEFDVEDGDNNGPPLEPEGYEQSYDVPFQELVPASVPLRPLPMKPKMRVKAPAIEEAPSTATPISVPQPQPQPKRQASVSESIHLSCKLSASCYKRLKLDSLLSGRSIIAILEGWI